MKTGLVRFNIIITRSMQEAGRTSYKNSSSLGFAGIGVINCRQWKVVENNAVLFLREVAAEVPCEVLFPLFISVGALQGLRGYKQG